ncbi:glycoside hydrolase [Gymnopus androsaceus JB14]|uniref:Glycoside hydrolase n=1 Tax=Gymnopus androsaceus JB14 TaxID=1447944 RepID=A0A6A4GP15_9AGAR|nr:glycoside hydrolase [Gymnopus androsaceus JB14]
MRVDLLHIAPTKAAGQNSVGYDVYDLYDLGEFDQKGGRRTKYGTKEELMEAVKKAHENGIVTYVDAVLNHRFGADRPETFGAVEVDENDRTKEISDLVVYQGVTGFDFAAYSALKWNFNHLQVWTNDENQRNSIYLNHSGSRTQARAHTGLQPLQARLRDIDHKPPRDTARYHLPGAPEDTGVFDAPLHYNLKEAGDRGAEYDMRAIWDGTVVQKRPIDAVTLVDNHEYQVGQSLESWVSPTFKPLAYALILLRPSGYPCVFWGDLYGTAGPEGNPQKPVSQLADLIRARKLYAYGELRDYWDHMNCVGWVRTGDEKRPGCAVVLCNGGEGFKRMEVGKEHANETWTDLLGWYQGEVTIGEDGWAEFKCSAMSVSVWVKKDANGRDEFGKA